MSWGSIIAAILGGLAGGLAGGFFGWAGSFHIHKKVENLNSVDELRRSFYEYLKLSSNYWTLADEGNVSERKIIESQMMIHRSVIMADYDILAKRNKQIKKSYDSTTRIRVELWDAATGGCFQQKNNWHSDPERIERMASAVIDIVKSLY